MKTTLLMLGLLFSVSSMASAPDMIPVTNDSPPLVKDFGSGVCSIGYNTTGTDCCTGFRIGENLIMTNFHCLACVHGMFKALVGGTPRFMEPSRFLYSFPKDKPKYMQKMKDYLAEKKINVDMDQLFIPSNDKEFRTLLNTYPELFTRINFKNTIDNESAEHALNQMLGAKIPDTALLGSTLQIKEVMSMNLTLDYSILRVEGMDASQRTFELAKSPIFKGEDLAVIGHPSQGPYPNKKVYDASKNCEVLSASVTNMEPRVHVFTHQCDTAPGSSGSPIFDRNSGTVVGIHWGASGIEDVRFGIQMKSIVNDFTTNN